MTIPKQTASASHQEARSISPLQDRWGSNWVYFISSIIACEYVCLFVYRDVHASVGGGQWYQMVPKLAGVAGACEPLAWVTGTELWPFARIGSVLTVKLSAHRPPHPRFLFFDTEFYVV